MSQEQTRSLLLAVLGATALCAEAFLPITGRCFRVVSRQDGQAC